jgi:putative ABC transport system substrate-binding protein
MAHPGGNITGVSALGSLEIFGKRLQLLKELVPTLSRLAVLLSTEQQGSGGPKASLAKAAQSLNIELREFVVLTPSDLEAAVDSAKEWGVQGLYTFSSGFTFSFGEQINKVANANGLPTVHSLIEGAAGGGLLAYAADIAEAARVGASYVDKILRGTPPGELPFAQLTKYDLLINLKTAKALGLTVPPTMLALANEVIE